MTWSIIARDSATGQFGIAVATKFFAVGARVPHIARRHRRASRPRRWSIRSYGIDGLRLLREGMRAARRRRRADRGAMTAASSRQLHVMDAHGRIAAHTGTDCVDWCGHIDGRRLFGRRQHAGGRRACSTTPRRPTRRTTTLPFARRLIAAHEGGRSGRRRQARQAVGGAADLRRGGMVRPRPARRRPRRSARRAGAARSASAASAGCISGNSCRRAQNPAGITDRADHRRRHRQARGRGQVDDAQRR